MPGLISAGLKVLFEVFLACVAGGFCWEARASENSAKFRVQNSRARSPTKPPATQAKLFASPMVVFILETHNPFGTNLGSQR